MKAAVMGGSGFIGFHLVKRLIAEGHEVSVFDVKPPPERLDGANLFLGDIRRPGAVEPALAGREVVFHLTAVGPQSRMPDREKEKINLGGTRAVLEAAVRAGVKRVVFFSSSEVYGVLERVPCPEGGALKILTPYARHKLDAENLFPEFFERHGLEFCILRPTSVFGPRMYMEYYFYDMIEQALSGMPIPIVGRGLMKLHIVHVGDLVSCALLAALKKEASGEAFNVAGPSAPFRQIPETICKRLDSRSRIVPVPYPLAYAFQWLRYRLRLAMTPAIMLRALKTDYVLDTAKARERLKWAPSRGFEETILDNLEWYLDRRAR